MTEALPSDAPAAPPFPGVPAPLALALSRRGIERLTPVQVAVVQALEQAGGVPPNLRISSQTGSGKTVALGLAITASILSRENQPEGRPAGGPLAVVITPTRELTAQVQEELSWLLADLPGTSVESVTGGTDVRQEQRRLRRRAPSILVATPGRLLDHLRSGAVNLSDARDVVLDEADQMLDMGFKDELDAIVERLPEERRSHLVSATFPPAVGALAQRFQGDAQCVQGTALGRANADISHEAYPVRAGDRYRALVNLLLDVYGERCLVFVRTRAETSELAETLAGDGFSALPFSGELPQAQRTRTLAAFRNGTVNVLVATDVAARGIDVPDIATVIHTDVPSEPDVYTHRSGRTGRAGKTGKSLLIVPLSARRRVERVLSMARVEATWRSVPSSKKIRQAVTKATRRTFYENLTEMEPSEAELEYSRGLLEKLPPEKVVAQLLRMAETRLPREPFDIPELEARSAARSERPTGPPRRGPSAAADGFVQFSLNWGARRGATPARCMSHLCRRGSLGRQQIGAIDVGEQTTVVEIRREVAADFEQRCRTPDERDPHVQVSRLTATSHGRERAADGARRKPASHARAGGPPPRKPRAHAGERKPGPRRPSSRPAAP